MFPQHIQSYFVIAVVTILFTLIYLEKIKASVGFLLTVLIFSITGILTSKDVLAGFSNESIASIIMLVLISSGIRKNFKIEALFDLLFDKAKSYKGFLAGMMALVASLSSFVNNTPVVALMAPFVVDWGEKRRIAPSKLLIPLSFATIVGGMITIIGTSTTLVMNGFLQKFNTSALNSIDFLIIGSSVSIVCILFIWIFGNKLLPDRKDMLNDYSENHREYVTETRLLANSILINKTVQEAGLRNLKGVYLVEIIRNGRMISPVSPKEVLMENDSLFFAGNTSDIVDLIDRKIGLDLPSTARTYEKNKTEVLEAVISNYSNITGKTVKESNFRNRYNAAIIAVNRNGERVRGKIGDIKLESGDLLLLYGGEDFRNRTELYRDLFIISKLKEIKRRDKNTTYAIVTILLCALVLIISGKFSLFPSLLIILAVMIGFKLISAQDVKRELDLNMISILVFSLAIGEAIYKTNAGKLMADNIMLVFQPFGLISILIGLFLITNILTSFITNVGAVSIAFPIAYSMAQNLGINGMPLYLAVTYASSAAFLTPIGYQTNLIIYGPGGYNFKDFFRIGLPVNIIYGLISISSIIFLYREVFFP